MLKPNESLFCHPYEGVIMMEASTPVEEQKNLFKKNKEIIESFSGQIHHIDTWGERKLANTINKQHKAIYFHFSFKASSGAIEELERTMKLNDRVLRVVHTRLAENISLEKHLENFKNHIAESMQKKKEKEAKLKTRKANRK